MIQKFRSKKTRQYYFRILAPNGKTIAQSEGYKTRRSRDNGIAAVVRVVANGIAFATFSTRKGELGE